MKCTNIFIYPGAIDLFYSTPRIPGVCYASNLIAIGEFDQRGGTLKLIGEAEVSLKIPPKAIKDLQLIYIALQCEPCITDDQTASVSPIIDCGPDGLQFHVS